MSEHRVTLVTAFIEACGGQPVTALGVLNRELGTSYEKQRLGQWRRGDRPVPMRVQRVMRWTVLEHQVGRELAEELAPMLETPWQPDIELEVEASASSVHPAAPTH